MVGMNLTDTATITGCAIVLVLALLTVTGTAAYGDRKNWWTGRSPVAEWTATVALAGWSAALIGSEWPVSAGLCLMAAAGCGAWRVTQRADQLHGRFTEGDTLAMLSLGFIVAAEMLLSVAYPTLVGAWSLAATVVAAYAAWNGALVSELSRMSVLSPGYSLLTAAAGVAWAVAGVTEGAVTVTAAGGVLITAGVAAVFSGRKTTRRRIR